MTWQIGSNVCEAAYALTQISLSSRQELFIKGRPGLDQAISNIVYIYTVLCRKHKESFRRMPDQQRR